MPTGGTYFKCTHCNHIFQGVGRCPFCKKGSGIRQVML